ncbi:MAG: UDP-3-O-acyl-N-acetylglucosamine deacetylase, partial [bacterium]
AGSLAGTERCTALGVPGGPGVRTVEHLLAACVFAGLDNAYIRVEGEEIPAADGSALPFLELIEAAGLAEQDAPARLLALAAPVAVEGPNGRVRAEPAEAPAYAFRFRGGGALDGRSATCAPDRDDPRGIAAARTFCYEAEIPALLAAGLGRGGTAENVLVLRADGTPVNAPRFPDEAVRHKLLDLIGDLALAGGSLAASVSAEGSGHALHAMFVRALAQAVGPAGREVRHA